MALTFDVAMNERAAVQSAKKLGDSLEDIDKELDLVAKNKALGDVEKDMQSLQRESKQTERSVEQVGDGAKKSFDKAGDATGEFKDEARSNFSEITSSFDGSMSSIGELAQGTLGGLANSGLPGVGIAAGVAALGIGAITTEMTRLDERSKEVKEGIIADFIEVGDALAKEAVDARVLDILNVEGTRKEAALLAEIMDITVGQAALAMAGDFESAGVTVDEVMGGINEASGNVDFTTWQDLKVTVESTTGAMEAGRQAAEARADAENRTAATVETAQSKQQAAIGKTADALRGFPSSFSTKLTVDTSAVTNARAELDRLQARANRGITLAFNRTGAVTWE